MDAFVFIQPMNFVEQRRYLLDFINDDKFCIVPFYFLTEKLGTFGIAPEFLRFEKIYIDGLRICVFE